MGSLVGGWDSSVSDSKFVRYQRNRSLTREKIENYWKIKKKTEEEHLKAISASPNTIRENAPDGTDKRMQRSTSLPQTGRDGNLLDNKTETSLKSLLKDEAWWTRSNWAFLNEAPVLAWSEDPPELDNHTGIGTST